jgi:hypothetical protein
MKTALIVIGFISTIGGIILTLNSPLEDLTLFTCSREVKAQESCTRIKIVSSKVESKTISVQNIKMAKVEKEIAKQAPLNSSIANNDEESLPSNRAKTQNEVVSPNAEFQYRLVLVLTTSDEVLPLTSHINENKYETEKDKINNFLLALNETSLNIKLDHSYTSRLYLGLFLSIIGLIVLATPIFLWLSEEYQIAISNRENHNSSLKEKLTQWQQWAQQFQEPNDAYQALATENEDLKTRCEKYESQVEKQRREYESKIEDEPRGHKNEIQPLKKEITKLNREKKELLNENAMYKKMMPNAFITFNNDQKNPSFSGNFNRGDFMSEGINVGGNFNINATNSVVNWGQVSGNVSNAIAQLQQSTNPEAAQLAEWLKELQGAIEAEPILKPEDKAEALEQVGTLAKAGENPQDGALKKLSNTAVKILKGTIATLPDTAKLADACSKLLPLITKLLGI